MPGKINMSRWAIMASETEYEHTEEFIDIFRIAETNPNGPRYKALKDIVKLWQEKLITNEQAYEFMNRLKYI